MENRPTNAPMKSSNNRKMNSAKNVLDGKALKKQKIQDALAFLKTQYPLAFKENPEPLKIGIFEELLEKVQGKITTKQLQQALAWYTRGLMYHQAVLINTHRIDLEGKRCELITAEQREYSQKRLGEILAKAQQKQEQ